MCFQKSIFLDYINIIIWLNYYVRCNTIKRMMFFYFIYTFGFPRYLSIPISVNSDLSDMDLRISPAQYSEIHSLSRRPSVAPASTIHCQLEVFVSFCSPWPMQYLFGCKTPICKNSQRIIYLYHINVFFS